MSRLILEDNEVFNIWTSPEDYDEAEVVEINPDWYQDNGTPMCSSSDQDMVYSHTEVELPTPTIVTVIKDGVVDKIWVFYRWDKAEEKFTELMEQIFNEDGITIISEAIISEALIEGSYYGRYINTAICIGQPK